jgi:acyl carrier protein
MNTAEIQSEVVSALTEIAPEVLPAELETSAALRDQVDLDSMDWLNFLIEISRRFGLEIPESEYASMRTIDNIVGFLASTVAVADRN